MPSCSVRLSLVMLYFKTGFFADAMGGQSADPRSYNDDLP
jgi:hypothetical protein